MSYVRNRLGNPFSAAAPGCGFKDWIANAATGKVTDCQVDALADDCATSRYTAAGGKLTMDQARAQCHQGISHYIDNYHGGTADKPMMTGAIVAGVLFLGALVIVTRR